MRPALIFTRFLTLISIILWICIFFIGVICRAQTPPPAPVWLSGLTDIRPSLAGVVVLNQADGGHAPIRSGAVRDIVSYLAKRHALTTTTVGGGLQFANPQPGTVYLSKSSTAMVGHAVQTLTALEKLTKAQQAKIRTNWRDPVSPVLNFVPTGADGYAAKIEAALAAGGPVPPVIDESFTVVGFSQSVGPYVTHAAVACVAMQPAVFDRLKREGKLADMLKRCVVSGVSAATGLKPIAGYLPRIDQMSKDTHVRIATEVARLANAQE